MLVAFSLLYTDEHGLHSLGPVISWAVVLGGVAASGRTVWWAIVVLRDRLRRRS